MIISEWDSEVTLSLHQRDALGLGLVQSLRVGKERSGRVSGI